MPLFHFQATCRGSNPPATTEKIGRSRGYHYDFKSHISWEEEAQPLREARFWFYSPS
jgi:hypothetical protein